MEIIFEKYMKSLVLNSFENLEKTLEFVNKELGNEFTIGEGEVGAWITTDPDGRSDEDLFLMFAQLAQFGKHVGKDIEEKHVSAYVFALPKNQYVVFFGRSRLDPDKDVISQIKKNAVSLIRCAFEGSNKTLANSIKAKQLALDEERVERELSEHGL